MAVGLLDLLDARAHLRVEESALHEALANGSLHPALVEEPRAA